MEPTLLLQQFGFTEVEARVYLGLCEYGTATGYELSKAMRLPRANVYAALENLAGQGAAEKTSTAPVRFLAVHPDDLVDRLSARAQHSLRALREQLPRPASPAPDGFWVVTGDEAILAKAAEQIRAAACTVAVDAWAEEAEALMPYLYEAEERGIQVTLISIGPVATDLCRVWLHNREEVWAEGGRSLTLVVDGKRVLTGKVMGRAEPGQGPKGAGGQGARAVFTSDLTLVELASEGIFHDLLVMELQRSLGLSDWVLAAVEEKVRGRA